MQYRRTSLRFVAYRSRGDLDPFGQPPGGASGVPLAETCWRPAADVYETATAFTVTVELAGVDPLQLAVDVQDGGLEVEGYRRLTPDEPGGVYHVAEIQQGRFRLALALPARLAPESITWRYDRGLLRLSVAKAQGR